MEIYDSTTTPFFRAGDNSLIGELFHPYRLGRPHLSRYSIAYARVASGEKTLPHHLIRSSESYYILSGTGIMHTGDEARQVSAGQLVYIPPRTVQWIENDGDEELLFLAICDPVWREEDEIVGEEGRASSPVPEENFMKEAIGEAEKGEREGGIPIGSVLVRNGEIIGRGHNRRVQEEDPMMHAEIDCLRDAGRIGSYRDCTLYSTLMPCYLCAGAVVQFGIRQVVAGESRTFSGAREFMEAHGVKVIDLDLQTCRGMMERFIREQPGLWNEDIGNVN